jgi:hypothetical protein
LAELCELGAADVQAALAIFDFSQNAAEIWRGSKMPTRREVLESVSLNRTLSDASLSTTKRKPFDVLAERPSVQLSRGDTTIIELFMAGIKGWEAGLRRRTDDGKPLQN